MIDPHNPYPGSSPESQFKTGGANNNQWLSNQSSRRYTPFTIPTLNFMGEFWLFFIFNTIKYNIIK